MATQQVIVTLKSTDEDYKIDISMEFEPAIAGEKSKEIGEMSDSEKFLQDYAQHIGLAVLESLKT